MPKIKWLEEKCPRCGGRMNTWDVRCSKALGYLKYQVCEECLCKEYGRTVDELRSTMEGYFGMRPCQGL